MFPGLWFPGGWFPRRWFPGGPKPAPSSWFAPQWWASRWFPQVPLPLDILQALEQTLANATFYPTFQSAPWLDTRPPGTGFPSLTMHETGGSAKYNTGRGYYELSGYQFTVIDNDEVRSRALIKQVAALLDFAKPKFSDGYTMAFKRTSPVTALKLPGKGPASAYLYQQMISYQAMIGRQRPR